MSLSCQSHRDGLCYAELSQLLKMFHVNIDGGWRAVHSDALFLLDGLIIHLKICDPETNLQQFYDGFDLQGECISDYLLV
jgi:hypothetical protein